MNDKATDTEERLLSKYGEYLDTKELAKLLKYSGIHSVLEQVRKGTFPIKTLGLAALGDFERLPTGAALRRYWLDKLSGGEKEILQQVCEHGAQTRAPLMEATGYRETSMRTYLQRLAARKLVVVEGSTIKAAPMLFD